MGQHDAEELSIFNARHEPIGTAPRRRVHEEGLWHETFHCWIITPSERGGQLLLQMRSAKKDVWPSRLDASAGGHLAVGERVMAGAFREMEEEIGITIDESDLLFVGVRVGVDEFAPSAKNYELLHVFLTIMDGPLEDFRLQESEVDALISAEIKDLMELLGGKADAVPATRLTASAQPTQIELTRDDFPETLDDYYYKVAILSHRLLRGDAHLRI